MISIFPKAVVDDPKLRPGGFSPDEVDMKQKGSGSSGKDAKMKERMESATASLGEE